MPIHSFKALLKMFCTGSMRGSLNYEHEFAVENLEEICILGLVFFMLTGFRSMHEFRLMLHVLRHLLGAD